MFVMGIRPKRKPARGSAGTPAPAAGAPGEPGEPAAASAAASAAVPPETALFAGDGDGAAGCLRLEVAGTFCEGFKVLTN